MNTLMFIWLRLAWGNERVEGWACDGSVDHDARPSPSWRLSRTSLPRDPTMHHHGDCTLQAEPFGNQTKNAVKFANFMISLKIILLKCISAHLQAFSRQPQLPPRNLDIVLFKRQSNLLQPHSILPCRSELRPVQKRRQQESDMKNSGKEGQHQLRKLFRNLPWLTTLWERWSVKTKTCWMN